MAWLLVRLHDCNCLISDCLIILRAGLQEFEWLHEVLCFGVFGLTCPRSIFSSWRFVAIWGGMTLTWAPTLDWISVNKNMVLFVKSGRVAFTVVTSKGFRGSIWTIGTLTANQWRTISIALTTYILLVTWPDYVRSPSSWGITREHSECNLGYEVQISCRIRSQPFHLLVSWLPTVGDPPSG